MKQEEQRLQKAHVSQINKLRNVNSLPIAVVGKQYKNNKYDKQSLSYVKQRYYRLRKITNEKVIQQVMHFRFDDWLETIKSFISHYKMDTNPYAIKLLSLVDMMTEEDKTRFIQMGMDINLNSVYNQMGADLRGGMDEENILNTIAYDIDSIISERI